MESQHKIALESIEANKWENRQSEEHPHGLPGFSGGWAGVGGDLETLPSSTLELANKQDNAWKPGLAVQTLKSPLSSHTAQVLDDRDFEGAPQISR